MPSAELLDGISALQGEDRRAAGAAGVGGADSCKRRCCAHMVCGPIVTSHLAAASRPNTQSSTVSSHKRTPMLFYACACPFQATQHFEATLSDDGLLTIRGCAHPDRMSYTAFPDTRRWRTEWKMYQRASYQTHVLNHLKVHTGRGAAGRAAAPGGPGGPRAQCLRGQRCC